MKISNIKLSKTQIIDYTVAICLIISAVLAPVVYNMNSIPNADKTTILGAAAVIAVVIVSKGLATVFKSKEKEVIATN